MIRIGILGGAGYTAGELIRLLINHPEAKLVFVNSESNAGNLITDVHEGLYGDTDLRFTSEMPFDDVDVLFFCFGHGKSERFLAEHDVPAKVKIIDLAQDFRIAAPTHDFIYGLPEIHHELITKAQHVANPGCFATCIQLGLLPMAKAGLLYHDISVNAITGSTGAGQKPGSTTHFSWRNNNMSVYKVFNHQHLHEICQSINELTPADGVKVINPLLPNDAKDSGYTIDFIPYRGDFTRGIFCTEVVRFDGEEGSPTNPTASQLADLYKTFYQDAVFTHYVDKAIDLKQVVNTNKALVHIDKFGNKAVITCMIDNLLKGAVGQAVQNMNIMFGIPEQTGLQLKASAF